MSYAVLVDLDDTLIVEQPAADAAFAATAAWAADRDPRLDAERLTADVRLQARELWHAAPDRAYCVRIGISSWEGLWCRYDGSSPEMARLRAWAPWYRSEAWTAALVDQGVGDAELAAQAAERFGVRRRSRHAVFADAGPALAALAVRGPLVLVTNGAACLQREKLAASGLERFFASVVISAEVGVAKPDPAPFAAALAAVGADHGVMIGDSLRKDVQGALDAGLDAVWLNRGHESADVPAGVPVISSMVEMTAAVSRFT